VGAIVSLEWSGVSILWLTEDGKVNVPATSGVQGELLYCTSTPLRYRLTSSTNSTSRLALYQTLLLRFRNLLSSWEPKELTEGATRVALCWLMQVMFRWVEIALQQARDQPSLSAGPSSLRTSPVEP
jgi:hypothetical protein